MSSFRFRLLTVAAGLIAGTIAAFAAPAMTTANIDLRAGPGAEYAVTGLMYAQKAVEVGECSNGWCMISGGGQSGWAPSGALAIGATSSQPQPQPQPQPQWPQPQPQWPQPQPQPQPPIYEEAGACFYSERNFGGSSFCLEEGEALNSFRTWDNRIRSVEIFGGARVDLCSDRNMFGDCATLRSDTSRLPRPLDRRASSVEVY